VRKQPHTVAKIDKGLRIDYDPVFIADQESANLTNVWFHRGLIKKDLGWANYASNFGGPILLIDNFPRKSGDVHLLVFTDTKIHKKDNGNWVEKYANASANLDASWFSTITYDANGSDLYVVTNGVDPILKWDGGGANFANLGGIGTTKAKYVYTFKNRLILGYTIEGGEDNPFRVRWSVAGDPEDWANEGSGFVDIADSPDFITGFARLKDRLLVFKERSIWELAYVGGSTVFTPVRRIDAIGTFSPKSLVELGDAVLFFGSDNVYIYDGHNLESIGDAIYPLLYESDQKIVNADKLVRVPAVFVEELGEYWICVPTEGEIPDLVFKYSFQSRAWTKRYEEVTAYGFSSVDVGVAWIDQPGTWANQVGPWLTTSLRSGAPTTLKGDSQGNVYEDDRTNRDSSYAEFQTKDWILGLGARIVEVHVQYKGGPLSVQYSTDGGESWSDPEPKTLEQADEWTEGVVYLNTTTRKFRVKLFSTAEIFEVKWVEPWMVGRKRVVR